MYESAMGESFARLAMPLQQFHRLRGRYVLRGEVKVDAPASMLARLLARLLGTPLTASEGPITFELDADPQTETWTRRFPANVLTSQLELQDRDLVEKLRGTQMTFALTERDGQLHMHLHRLRFFGILCPAWLMPVIVAEESGVDGRVYFHVSVQAPYVGVVARYQGHLQLSSGGTA